jgi:uncharacterized lipoprotein YajG
MNKLILIFVASLLLAGCKQQVVVSDFCDQINTIGYERMLTKFTDAELAALGKDRKRALRDLKKAYGVHCNDHKTN